MSPDRFQFVAPCHALPFAALRFLIAVINVHCFSSADVFSSKTYPIGFERNILSCLKYLLTCPAPFPPALPARCFLQAFRSAVQDATHIAALIPQVLFVAHQLPASILRPKAAKTMWSSLQRCIMIAPPPGHPAMDTAGSHPLGSSPSCAALDNAVAAIEVICSRARPLPLHHISQSKDAPRLCPAFLRGRCERLAPAVGHRTLKCCHPVPVLCAVVVLFLQCHRPLAERFLNHHAL